MIDFFIELFSTAEILVGLVVALGCIILRKNFSDTLTSTAKTIIGLLILGAGANVVCEVLFNLSPLMQAAFHIDGLLPDTPTWPALALATDYGINTGLVLLGAFIVNIILARFTPMKYIFLTGHHMFWGAVITSVFLEFFGLPRWAVIVIGSLYLGFVFCLLPTINQKYMKKITGGQPIAMGHFGATGYLLAGWLGKYVGNPKDSTEDIKVSSKFEFVKETTVLAALMVVFMFIISSALAGSEFIRGELGVEGSIGIWMIMQGLTFGAGLMVIIYGVRMMIGEIIPAFEGIAQKVVPDAIPALDCPVVYPFAPNAVVIGFIVATITAFATSILFGVLAGIAIVPPIMQCFFMGGAGAVFGNATGGRRGAILGGAINGFLFVAIPPLFYLFSKGIVAQPVAMADPDFGWLGIILGLIGKLFGVV